MSFWSEGFDAVLIIEHYPPRNPHKDKVTDVLETLNPVFARRVVQVVISCVAHLAEIITPPQGK